jgi:hypothetical protein
MLLNEIVNPNYAIRKLLNDIDFVSNSEEQVVGLQAFGALRYR